MRILACADLHGNCNALTWVGNVALHSGADCVLIAGDICTNARYRHFVWFLGELSDHAKCPVIATGGNHDFWKPTKEFGNGIRHGRVRFLSAEEWHKEGYCSFALSMSILNLAVTKYTVRRGHRKMAIGTG